MGHTNNIVSLKKNSVVYSSNITSHPITGLSRVTGLEKVITKTLFFVPDALLILPGYHCEITE